MTGRVLIVAGSDSGGGAGIQADIKTVTMMGGYAATAITAVIAQNTLGVDSIFPVPPEFVARQMLVVLEDIGTDAIKIGMLGSAEVVQAVADVVDRLNASMPLVIDPVMIAKGGMPLVDAQAVAAIKRRLMVRADLLTPNLPEAEALTGVTIRDLTTMHHAAAMMRTLGCRAVLLKGGHLDGPTVIDLLVTEAGEEQFESPRLETPHTHGTGCTLASAVATGLALGLDLHTAVVHARNFVREAILHAPGLGQGHGPLGHNWRLVQDAEASAAAR